MPPTNHERPPVPRHQSSSAPTTITSVADIRADPRTPPREWSLFETTLLEGEEHPLRRTTSSLSSSPIILSTTIAIDPAKVEMQRLSLHGGPCFELEVHLSFPRGQRASGEIANRTTGQITETIAAMAVLQPFRVERQVDKAPFR